MNDAPYLRVEDEYGAGLGLDDKHCTDNELRLMIDGHEFYLTPDTAADLMEGVWSLVRPVGG